MSSSFLPRTPPAVLSSSNAMTAPLWDDCPNVASFPVREAYSPTLMVSLCREHDVTSSAPIASTEVRNVFMRVKTDACVHSTRSEEHTSELQSQSNLVCRLLLEKKK